MQICAIDSSASLILAENAHKHHDYRCIECSQIVRLRRGIHRKAHFFHIQPNRICKQHGKGMPHLMLQQFVKNILPEEEAQIECPFPTINRIADVAWHSKKLIFEIQCSPISKEEIKQRNENYTSIGYQVIWIFHDERYNQSRLSAAELLLSNHPHYFSDMNGEGIGKIYDQFSIISNGKREKRLPALPIDLSSPMYHKHFKIPRLLKPRFNTWTLAFAGDAIDSFSKERISEEQKEFLSALKHLQNIESHSLNFNFLKSFYKRWIVRPYQSFLKLLLERACR